MNTREWGIRLCSSSQVNCAFLNDPWPTEDAEILSICGGREHTNSLEYLIFRSTMLRHLQSFLILNVNENVSGQMLVIQQSQQSCCDCDGPCIHLPFCSNLCMAADQ